MLFIEAYLSRYNFKNKFNNFKLKRDRNAYFTHDAKFAWFLKILGNQKIGFEKYMEVYWVRNKPAHWEWWGVMAKSIGDNLKFDSHDYLVTRNEWLYF